MVSLWPTMSAMCERRRIRRMARFPRRVGIGVNNARRRVSFPPLQELEVVHVSKITQDYVTPRLKFEEILRP